MLSDREVIDNTSSDPAWEELSQQGGDNSGVFRGFIASSEGEREQILIVRSRELL